MLSSIRDTYRDSARLAVTLPLLLAFPGIAELSQHIIEYRLGMFESLAVAQAAESHPLRLGYGMLKILSLFLLTFWVSRALVYGRDGARPLMGDTASVKLFAWVVLFNLGLGALQLFGFDAAEPLIGERMVRVLKIGVLVLGMPLSVYLTLWTVGTSLGNARLTIPASFRIMHGSFWWSLGFLLAMEFPLLVLHYALNFLAIGRSFWPLWALLTLDSLLVGYLAIVLGAAHYVMAKRAADRKGVSLT